MSKATKTTVTITGNLGADPQLRTLPARTYTTLVYDKIIDDMVEREVTFPAKEYRTFSVAVRSHGEDKDRWVSCSDWDNLSAICRKGDRVELKGTLHRREYEKDGQLKIFTELRISGLSIKKTKIRHEAA